MLRQLFAASLCMTAVTAFGGGGATGAAPAPTVCPTGGKPDTNSKCTQYARMCTRSSRIITMCPCSCKGKTAAPTKPRSSGGRGSGRSNSTAAKYPKTMHKQCASNHRCARGVTCAQQAPLVGSNPRQMYPGAQPYVPGYGGECAPLSVLIDSAAASAYIVRVSPAVCAQPQIPRQGGSELRQTCGVLLREIEGLPR